MELLQLHYFRIAANTENITLAAKQLHIAQPSLSQTIKRLETELGICLFERSGRNVKLNDAGQVFLTYVNEIFISLDSAKTHLNELQDKNDNTITLLIRSCSMLLPDIIKQIKDANEDIQFNIFQNASVPFPETIDFTISASTIFTPTDCNHLLLEEQIVAALPKEHPLAEHKNFTSDQLIKEAFIALDEKSDLNEIITHYCEKNQFFPNYTITVDTPNVMRDLLRMKLGIALVPQKTWHDFASDTIVMRPLSDIKMVRYITLSWTPGKHLTVSALLCKKIIIDFFKNL